MPSLSCANLLDLVAGDGFPASPGRTTPRLPRVMTLPDTAFDDLPSAEVCPKRIVVSHRLPLRASPDPASPFNGVAFSYDMDTAAYQVRAGLPAPVIHVGALPDTAAPIDPSIQEELSQYLFTNFSCLPVFIPAELHSSFYHGFCKHYLWPLLHYMLPFTASSAGLPFDRSLYRSYLSANKLFADRITEVLNPDDDFVWVHDYHLLALPTFLRKRFPRVKLGFFLHSPFPSSEIFRTIPVRDDLLRALLNADLLGFHTFDYARHFLSSCSRLLGLGYQSKRGYIGIEYYGRTVTLKIMPIGIDMDQLRSVVTSPETVKKVKELTEQYKDRTLLLGVDDMDLFKGIGLKFRAMEQLLEHKPELHGKVVLIQITNPARSQGKDIQEVQEEIKSISDRINARFGQPGYKPIVHIDQPVPTYEKLAYYAVAECCVVNAIRDGLNRIPYIYTVCRHESAAALEATHNKSMLVVSEFIGCSPSLSGAIRVNPWNLDPVAEAMNLATTLPDIEKQLRHEKHYKYISTHDVTYWARSFDQDLQRACKDHMVKRCWGIGFGMGFRVVALGPNFRKLSVEHVAQAYKRSSRRLILLDYDGTMMPQGSINKAPSKDVLSVLNELCEDPKNVVFVVSGRGKDELGPWFAPCKGLGISAEHGFFTRWNGDSEWESYKSIVDFDWKNIAEPVMNLYTETTDGSYIEHKESALVWQHQYADPDFSSWQAKELLDHLENVLANEPVVVKRGQHIVEVNPQGISKGHVVENLLSTMVATDRAPDFMLCVGDDRSDEDMFEAVLSSKNKNECPEVFACTVGQKPSMARYYLDDTADVMKMLQGLVHVSVPQQNKGENHVPVSFEGSL